MRKSAKFRHRSSYLHRVQSKGSRVLPLKHTEIPGVGLTETKDETKSKNVRSAYLKGKSSPVAQTKQRITMMK
jgi:hypothetical protein